MQTTNVNPWSWSLNVGYNQAVLIENSSRQLHCAGQTSVDEEGAPMHLGDIRGQIQLALENLASVLKGADMSYASICRLVVYTTNADDALKNFDVLGQMLGAENAAPPMTLVEVNRLALPGLEIEFEATAVA